MEKIEWDFGLDKCINHNAYQELFCFSEEQEIILNITEVIANINPNKNSVGFFELNFSSEDKALLQIIK